MNKEEKLLYFVMEELSSIIYPNDLDDLKYLLDSNTELVRWWVEIKEKEKNRKKKDREKTDRISKAQESVRNWADT